MVFRFGCSVLLSSTTTQLCLIRYGHRMRGRAPIVARTLQQRQDELNRKDELYTQRINIGFPNVRTTRSAESNVNIDKQKLEYLSRKQNLNVDLEQIRHDWIATTGPGHIQRIADHYGVFNDLYGEGYFIPRLNLQVSYEHAETDHPVYYGNVIKPTEAQIAPNVQYEAKKDSLWTLTLTNLDGHLIENDKEYLHWFVANIPGSNIKSGETLVEYLQPIPPRGTGYHRYVFVLYKQTNRIDYDVKKVTETSVLNDRTFVSRDWYKKYEDVITPAGLAFHQTDWDMTLTKVYHEKLQMKEPVYEYDFPVPYIKPQKWFPLRQPFNLYMDKYRDPKQINKEYLERKLKTIHPFQKPPPPLKYPNAHKFDKSVPSWLKLHEKKIRLGWGRVNDV